MSYGLNAAATGVPLVPKRSSPSESQNLTVGFIGSRKPPSQKPAGTQPLTKFEQSSLYLSRRRDQQAARSAVTGPVEA